MPTKFRSATHIWLINPKSVVADWPMEKSDSFFLVATSGPQTPTPH